MRHKFKPHSMGCNAVSLHLGDGDLTVSTGGDDQALHVSVFKLHAPTMALGTVTVPNAMSSAIKAAAIRGGEKIYITGYDQRVVVFTIRREVSAGFANVSNNAESIKLEQAGSAFVSVTDVSDAAVIGLRGGGDIIVVVGDGLEVLTVGGRGEREGEGEEMERARAAIRESTHLLVVAGAGMGKDSGLPTFEELGVDGKYKDMCDPLSLVQEERREAFYDFWEKVKCGEERGDELGRRV